MNDKNNLSYVTKEVECDDKIITLSKYILSILKNPIKAINTYGECFQSGEIALFGVINSILFSIAYIFTERVLGNKIIDFFQKTLGGAFGIIGPKDIVGEWIEKSFTLSNLMSTFFKCFILYSLLQFCIFFCLNIAMKIILKKKYSGMKLLLNVISSMFIFTLYSILILITLNISFKLSLALTIVAITYVGMLLYMSIKEFIEEDEKVSYILPLSLFISIYVIILIL